MTGAPFLQSVLDPAGPQAGQIAGLWSLMLGVATVVFLVVSALAAVALIKGLRRSRQNRHDTTPERTLAVAVGSGVALTVAALFVLLVASVHTGRAVASLGAESAVSIKITGHQWWWEVEYEDAMPSRIVRTANEIHLPVNRPVVLKVTSRDVIHSFWVPNLSGKRDLIPGYTTALWLQADRPGIYRGQCAEFCGYQHARMATFVAAEPAPEFERWLENQRQPAVSAGPQGRGLDVFLRSTCTQCHTIRGTSAGAVVGPDLTHLASRGTIAAGTLPNTRESLARWIRNAQQIKPGSRMPPNPLGDDDLQALVGYLETLK